MRLAWLAVALFLLQEPQAPAPASIEGMVVRLGTRTPVAGARVAVATAQMLTDENGHFIFQNVPPGRYRISVSHDDFIPAQFGQRLMGSAGREVSVASGQTVKDIMVELTPKGMISGRVSDSKGDPVADARVQALKYVYQDGRRILVSVNSARSNQRGEYQVPWLVPGPYIVSADPQHAGEGFLPIYYPGTTDASTASVIDVPPGLDFSGIDLVIVQTQAVRVLGRVVNGITGESMSAAAISLVPRRGTVATGSLQRAQLSAAGTFEFRQMAPGSYDLVGTANPSGDRLAASLPLDISNRDIDGITLTLLPQLSIIGVVRIENLPANTGGLNLSGVRVELRREPYTPELLIILPTVAPDGTFTLTGVTPGDYRLKVETRGFKGYAKSARFGALDALNPPFRIDGPGQFDIVIGLNPGSLEAVALDDMQMPFPDATVVLVPDPPRRQRFDLYAAAADASGRIRLNGIAPGDYRLFAWDDVPADAWQDPDFIRPYENRGKPVRISEGSSESLQVSVMKGR